MNARLLLVYNEEASRRALTEEFSGLGVEVEHAGDGDAALEMVARDRIDVVITGLKLPGISGLTLLRRIHEHDPEMPVILVTAYGTVASAVEAMKAGAYDFIERPFDRHQVRHSVERALAMTRLVQENRVLREEIERQYDFSNIVGSSPEMLEILGMAGEVARTDSNVLITGESGTGKELLARAIHYNSTRAGHPFVAINCATLPENLLESELFGYEKGAFTGATKRKIGRFEMAAGGTLFLDEIGDMSPAVQVKLLRVLEDREFTRLGGTRTLSADVRLIVATNQDLGELVEEREFRDDLYYRINVFPIKIPPLRERQQDLMPLIRHFLEELSERTGKVVEDVEPEARRLMQQYGWPGNVRELKNVLERAVILTRDSTIKLEHLPSRLRQEMGASVDESSFRLPEDGVALEEVERNLLTQAMNRAHNNKSEAARLLGLSRATIRYRLKKYDLEPA